MTCPQKQEMTRIDSYRIILCLAFLLPISCTERTSDVVTSSQNTIETSLENQPSQKVAVDGQSFHISCQSECVVRRGEANTEICQNPYYSFSLPAFYDCNHIANAGFYDTDFVARKHPNYVLGQSAASPAKVTQTKRASCLKVERSPFQDVEVINATFLKELLQSNLNITNRSTPAPCYLIYFFSPHCPFSVQGSPYVNALARSLPNILVYGLNSIEHHGINAWYGVMGTPSLVLFHNGNVAGRYNASEYSTFFLGSFIEYYTNQKVQGINVTSLDFKSNLPNQLILQKPFALYFAWAFLIILGAFKLFNSQLYAKFTEVFVDNWREAEAQQEHD